MKDNTTMKKAIAIKPKALFKLNDFLKNNDKNFINAFISNDFFESAISKILSDDNYSYEILSKDSIFGQRRTISFNDDELEFEVM